MTLIKDWMNGSMKVPWIYQNWNHPKKEAKTPQKDLRTLNGSRSNSPVRETIVPNDGILPIKEEPLEIVIEKDEKISQNGGLPKQKNPVGRKRKLNADEAICNMEGSQDSQDS